MVQLLGADLSRGAAQPRLGRRHPLGPLRWSMGAAILPRTEAALGLTARARGPENLREEPGSGAAARLMS